jgi:hypothetical protein
LFGFGNGVAKESGVPSAGAAGPVGQMPYFERLAKLLFFPATLLITVINTRLASGNSIGIPCLFKTLCGVECYGCGISRSVMALWQGNVAESFEYNRLGVLVFLVLAWLSFREFYFFISQQKEGI